MFGMHEKTKVCCLIHWVAVLKGIRERKKKYRTSSTGLESNSSVKNRGFPPVHGLMKIAEEKKSKERERIFLKQLE